MKRLFVLAVVSLLIANIASATSIVTFNDPNLRAAVRHTLGFNILDANHPTTTDMLSLTSLDANSLGISDLTGLQTATNLTTLSLINNKLGNIDLLAGLIKMQYLYLDDNLSINSLLALANMNDLIYLRASNCSISNINVISNFKKLESLSLNNNNISDITHLADVNDFLSLYLAGNNIADINVFKSPILNNLRELDLSDNLISDINALSGLTKLINLQARYNNFNDITAIKNLTGLIYLYLSHNNITNITALKDMKSLAELGLTDVNLVDISPLADVNQIQYLWLDFNPITDINVMTKYNHLKMFSLYFNPLSFKSWCVYLKQVINNNPSATGTYSNQLLDDRFTDWKDLSVFADQWLQNCNLANGYCHGADFSEDGKVDFYDFAIFANWWMYNK
jgi:Leucine-rich repeat (LRR) protein